jgi:hypothetical protein
MRLNEEKFKLLAKYTADLSKIVFASTVVNFFLVNDSLEVTTPVFVGGLFISLALLGAAILLTKPN